MSCVLIGLAVLAIVAGMAGYELWKDGVWHRLDHRMRRDL